METLTTGLVVWHFAGATLRDGRPLPKAGDTLKHEGEVVPCESGLHGSVRALDALQYAPGHMVALCELRGEVVPHDTDKHAASERHYLTDYVDASRELHLFACWCATKALDREEAAGRKVDPRSRRAIEVKLLWLDGKATDEDLDAALAAAWDAAALDADAWDAAWDEHNAELERRLHKLLEAAR